MTAEPPRAPLHLIARILGFAAILSVCYVLSAGPAVYLVVRINGGELLIRKIYAPLINLPETPFTDAFWSYTNWCAETAAKHAELR